LAKKKKKVQENIFEIIQNIGMVKYGSET